MKKVLLALGLSIACGGSFAVFDPVNDDTDLFRNNPNIPAERPNVLIILDNTANWNTAFDNEKAALVSVVNSLDSAFNVGLMLFPETGGGNDSIDGGYVKFAMRQMLSANKTALASIVGNLDKLADKGNNSTIGLAMHEAYLYFGGQVNRASFGKVKTDFTGNTANNPLAAALGGSALPASPTAASAYTSAITDACAKNYIIFISNGPTSENASARSTGEALLTAAKGSAPSILAISPSGQQANWADEYAKFMAENDVSSLTGKQTAITYVVEVDPGSTGQAPDMTALAKSMAINGQGKYFAVTSSGAGASIVAALQAIFSEIQAVNSVFAASTLPVSVNVRGTNLNQLYIGVFRPDSGDLPRWLGNLKAYQLKKDPVTGTVFTVDAAGNPAINNTTGFITSTALSFWTSATQIPTNYWAFRASGQNGVGGDSDSPDGDLVEKGGAAQQVRSLYFANGVNDVTTPRKLYTCTQGLNFPVCAPGTSLSATPFDITNTDITAASLALNTHPVTPLTAAQTQAVTALADTRDASLSNTWFADTVSSLTTNNTASTVTSLVNTTSVNISAISNGAVATTINSVVVANGGNKVATVTLASAVTLTAGQTVVISGTTNFNGTIVIPAGGVIDSTHFKFGSFTGPITENPASGKVTTSNTTVNVTTATNHPFVVGATVTIANVTPSNFNGVKTITAVGANSFAWANEAIAVAPASNGSTMTATSFGTTVTATTSAAHPYVVGQTITISGASPSGFNGSFTIVTVPDNTHFTYQTSPAVGSAATGTISATGAGTQATAIIANGGNAYVNGTGVTITGATPAGYNGTFTLTGVAVGAFTTTLNFTVPPGLGTATGGTFGIRALPAAGATSRFVVVALPNHGFSNGQSITVGGVSTAGHNGAWTVYPSGVIDANTFFYDMGSAFPVPVGSPTVRLTSNPKAYATITAHGYSGTPTVTIAGATPSGYNGTYTATVEDVNTIRYVLSSAQGANTGTSVSASIATTTALATSTAHGFTTGGVVTISGAVPTAFNGAFNVTVTSPDTFTYTLPSEQLSATGTITALSSGAGASQANLIINWIRGEDNYQDENANSSFADTRASIHGDVLHARPAVVNYNRRADADPANVDNDVYIFYGGNDGVFRAVKGGFGSTTGDAAPGAEVWGFVAPEHFPYLNRLRVDAPAISSNFKRNYFFDGPMGTYALDANNDGILDPVNKRNADGSHSAVFGGTGDKVWLFLTMRRGGRGIYALDVSDPLTPKLLWRKGCPSLSAIAAEIDSVTGCDLGWGELGQTWSEPKVISINASSNPVLLFGAGYDPLVEDLDPSTITASNTTTVTAGASTFTRSMGRGLYMVDATNGAILWQASGRSRADSSTHPYKVVSGMDHSIPSDIAVVLGDSTPKPFRAYVGDTGGNMWRLDFGDANPANWTVANLASIASTAAASSRRKFMFAPDVVGTQSYDMVLAGTGDREHPFDTTVINRVYGFKDTVQSATPAVVSGAQLQATITETATMTYNATTIKKLLDVSTNCIQVPANCTGASPQVAAGALTASQNTSAALGQSANTGWYVTLAAGEKQVGGTLAAGGGAVVFGTNQPSASAGGGACAPNLGVARQYSINFLDGTAFTGTSLSTTYAGGGFLPSPVLVFVGLGGASGTGTGTGTGVPVGGTISGGTIQIGAAASMGGGNDPTGVVCYGASCSLAPGKQLYSRLRKFWYKEID